MNDDRSVYEVRDVSDPDMYFSVGVFPSLGVAIEAILNCTDPTKLSESARASGEQVVTVEVWERGMGWDETGKMVYRHEWFNRYVEEDDEYRWEHVPDSGSNRKAGF